MLLPLIAGTGVVAAAGACFAGFHAMWPTSQVYGRTVTGIAPGSKLLALTYDDGPDPRNTPALLEVLAKHGAKATFFMLGRHVALHPQMAREVVHAGHAVGNHTQTHPRLIFTSPDQIEVQIKACAEAISQATGTDTKLFRPPFGGRTPRAMAVVSRLGYTPVMWRVSSDDWKAEPAPIIVNRLVSKLCGGEVVLMHDGGHLGPAADRSQTIAATDQIISRYKAEGYRFVTVPELINL